MQTALGLKDILLESTAYLFIAYKEKGESYNEKQEIEKLIKESRNIEFKLHYILYLLTEDIEHIQKAYAQIQETLNPMKSELKNKFLSYPVPRKIADIIKSKKLL